MENIRKNIMDLRKEYLLTELNEKLVDKNPIIQFSKWFHETISAELNEPNSMALGTCSSDGKPSVRIVLLKDFTQEGFVFYTNYNSRKGKDLSENPFGALTFFWPELQRQVRIEGSCEKLPPEISDEYFSTRPRGSQLGALASHQSSIVTGRKEIEENYYELEKFYEDKEIKRPEHWGGYLVRPEKIEFWQGRANRLHDRVQYVLNGSGNWEINRLAP